MALKVLWGRREVQAFQDQMVSDSTCTTVHEKYMYICCMILWKIDALKAQLEILDQWVLLAPKDPMGGWDHLVYLVSLALMVPMAHLEQRVLWGIR